MSQQDERPDPVMELIEGVRAMVYDCAFKYVRKYRCGHLEDDLVASAFAHLWDCTSRGLYDPSRGAYTTWAHRAIHTAFADEYCRSAYPVSLPPSHTRQRAENVNPEAAEAANRARRPASLSMSRWDDAEWALPDDRPPVDEQADAMLAKEAIARQVARLSPHRREAVSWYYGLGGRTPLNCREIAERSGVTQSAASQAVREARRQLAAPLSHLDGEGDG